MDDAMTEKPNLISLPARTTVAEDAIERLEQLLGMFKSGECESFICAAFRTDGTWCMIFSGQHNTAHKIGILEIMKMDLASTLKD